MVFLLVKNSNNIEDNRARQICRKHPQYRYIKANWPDNQWFGKGGAADEKADWQFQRDW